MSEYKLNEMAKVLAIAARIEVIKARISAMSAANHDHLVYTSDHFESYAIDIELLAEQLERISEPNPGLDDFEIIGGVSDALKSLTIMNG